MKATKQVNDSKQGASVVIWHPLIRLIHWYLVAAFFLNYFVVEAGAEVHQWLGYGAVLAVILRIVWGFFDKGYGHFRHLQLNRQAFTEHWAHLRQRQVPKQSGHNPMGWLMILLVFTLFIGLGVTGFLYEEVDALFGNSLLEELHEWFANILYASVIIHIVAVLLVSWWGRIGLVKTMLTGKRDG